MAKFNTLAGGYYGKLGATVGQRWKNLRTVRTYVIPANPQTPTQQANRNRFSDCVWYAQIAQQINPKTTAFDTTAKTLWNCRMSTARALQDLNLSEMDRIPLYPTTLSVPFTISAANITRIVDSTHIVVSVEGATFETERILMMLVLLPGAEDWKDRLALCIGSNGDEGGNDFTFRIPEGVTLGDGLKCRFCSCDDVDSAIDLIASSQINLSYAPIDEHTFDTSVRSLSRNGNNYTLVMNEPFINGTTSVGSVKAHIVAGGEWRDWNISNATLINSGGYFALTFATTASHPSMIPAFPSGAYITISSISAQSSLVRATAENVTESVSNSDLTRTYENTITGVSRDGDTFTFAFDYNVPNSNNASGSWDFHAVSNGEFVDIHNHSATFYSDRFTFEQSSANDQNRYAFPTGSTVTYNITFVKEGVTYQPQTTTAQSVVSTDDLTRSIINPLSWSSTDNAFVASLASGAVITSGGKTFNANTKNHNNLFQHEQVSSFTFSFNGNKVLLSSSDFGANTILLDTDSFSIPSETNFVASGVTYSLPAQTVSVTKNGTQTLSASVYEFEGAIDENGVYFTITDNSVAVVPNSQPDSTSLHAPSTIEVVDSVSAHATITVDNTTFTVYGQATSFDIGLEADVGSSGLDYGNDCETTLSSDFYITDGSGNKWYLPAVAVTLSS